MPDIKGKHAAAPPLTSVPAGVILPIRRHRTSPLPPIKILALSTPAFTVYTKFGIEPWFVKANATQPGGPICFFKLLHYLRFYSGIFRRKFSIRLPLPSRSSIAARDSFFFYPLLLHQYIYITLALCSFHFSDHLNYFNVCIVCYCNFLFVNL